MPVLKKIISNKILIYLASRYGTYALQFVISLVIAEKLGPYYMGFYGIILLVLNYFAQFHFGIANSLNILLVHNKNDIESYKKYVNNSLALVSFLDVCIMSLFLYYWLFGNHFISKLSIDQYLPYICVIAILEHFDGVLTNILRVKNYVTPITLIQSLNVFFNTCVIFFFDGKNLVLALVISLMISNAAKAIIALICKIVPRIEIKYLSWQIQREILFKGFCLFIYNSCLMFVLIGVRTLISGNYSLEEFGFFTFSFTIANAVMLLLDSLAFIVFPKLIDILSSHDIQQIRKSLNLIKDLYISTAHLFIYFAILLFPVLLTIMPKYQESLTSMNLIALTVLMSTNKFGYSTFLIAQNKEKIAAKLAFSTMALSIVLGLCFVKIMRVEFHYVILSTLLTYTFYSIACAIVGERLVGEYHIGIVIKSIFPLRLFSPFFIALVLSILEMESLLFIPLVIYLIFNVQTMKNIFLNTKRLVYNPHISDI